MRNTLKYVAEKDKKAFANDLKSIYHAPNEESGYERMQSVTKKWQEKYPNAMRRWEENWDVLSPMFKFSAEVRKVMYTTNAIESLNSVLRRLNSQRSVFPSDTALLKALYLAPLKQQRSGQCHLEIGAEFTENCQLCMMDDLFSIYFYICIV